jgi:hypothetical protein
MKDSYFKVILLNMIEEIIKKYDGKTIKDTYGTNKFKDGKWLVKESGKWDLKFLHVFIKKIKAFTITFIFLLTIFC